MPTKQKVEVVVAPKKSTSKSIAVIPSTPEDLIARAIDQGSSIETIERMVALAERVKASQAKEAFDEAMSNLQSEMPIIKKSKQVKNKNNQLLYSYAPIDSIVIQTRPFISKNGFSYQIKTETKDKGVKAICIVKHRLGHSEFSDMEVPLGNKTDIMSNSQVTASALTFAKRYAFCDAFGIVTGDTDDDAISTQTTNKPAPTPTPVIPPKAKTPTLKETMDMILQAIKESENDSQLINIDEQTQSSSKFSKTFKAKVKKLTNDKVNEINKK